MITKRLLMLAVALLGTLTMAISQSLSGNLSNVNIGSLPDSQIKEYAQKIKKNGMTLDQALQQAKLRGATERQIKQLRQRMSRYFTTGSSSLSANGAMNSKQQEIGNNKDVSSKSRFLATAIDSMIFGFTVFNKKDLTFEPSENFAVSGSYRIGVGDEVNIDIYGAADQSYSLYVAQDGTLNIPMVGPVMIGGLQFDDAKTAIMSKMSSIYSDMGNRTKASIRIGAVKPVTISVMGETFAPGTYTVSAAATLMHVLYLCGGPNSKGSLRDIQIIRGGKIVSHFDAYDFLVNGKNSGDIGLADGDIVMIPTYVKRVSAGGAFKRIGYFEAKEGETVADLIRFAGGFAPLAMTSHIGLIRVGKHTTEFKEVTNPQSIALADGDSLFVSEIDVERMDNSVSVVGAVFAEGLYEYSDGMTLKQLIDKAGGLKENAFLNRGVITRYKDDYTLESLNFNVGNVANGAEDIPLKSNDKVTIMSIDEMQEMRTLTISGEVNEPGIFLYRENITIGDLIVLASGLTEKASHNNVEILRCLSPEEAEDSPEHSNSVEVISITRNLSLDNEKNSFVLEPYDRVIIRSRNTANLGGTINLVGAFNYPGDFSLSNNEVRLSEVVSRSGGVSGNADVDGARIYRKIKMTDIEKELKLQRIVDLNLDTMAYLRENSSQYELVSVNLREAIANPGSDADIYLCDQDQLVVPDCSQTVRVNGTVQSPTSMMWTDGWNAKKYVKAAGGFASRAQKKKTYVVYPNGQSESVRHVLWFRIYPSVRPGSEVIVPEKPEPTMTLPAIVSMSASVVSMIAVIVALM